MVIQMSILDHISLTTIAALKVRAWKSTKIGVTLYPEMLTCKKVLITRDEDGNHHVAFLVGERVAYRRVNVAPKELDATIHFGALSLG